MLGKDFGAREAGTATKFEDFGFRDGGRKEGEEFVDVGFAG